MKIFNLNCWILPPPFSKENKSRIKNIIHEIKKHNPDIIALQEVWLNKYVKIIKRSFPEYYFYHSNNPLFNKTGLITATKIKPLEKETSLFKITKNHNIEERLGKKGFHKIKLKKDLYFYNTHLYCPKKESDDKIVFSEFNLIQEEIGKNKSILSGDLNIEEKNLSKLNKKFTYDKSYKKTVSSSNNLAEYGIDKQVKYDKKIDYTLLTKNFRKKIQTKCFEKPILSDHYFLISKIK